MKPTLSIDSLLVVRWWIDASYSTHGDCRGHAAVMISLGWVTVLVSSLKHSLNMNGPIEG